MLPSLLQSIQVTKISDVVFGDQKALISLIKSGQTNELRAALVYLLSDLVLSFNVGKTMNVNQVAECCRLIIEMDEFLHLKPGDFKIAFDRAKTGRYGKLYDCLDMATVFNFIRYYDSEREEEIIAFNRTKAANLIENKQEQQNKVSFKEILDSLPDKKQEQKKVEKRPASYGDALCRAWISKFDRIYYKQENPGGVRNITVKGKNMTIDDYLMYKMKKCKILK